MNQRYGLRGRPKIRNALRAYLYGLRGRPKIMKGAIA